ncbi:MAG: hypothetical protein V4449_02830 [Patescibacteria group bacterium]
MSFDTGHERPSGSSVRAAQAVRERRGDMLYQTGISLYAAGFGAVVAAAILGAPVVAFAGAGFALTGLAVNHFGFLLGSPARAKA